MMKILLIAVVLFAVACGKKDPKPLAWRGNVGNDGTYYRGYDIYSQANKCEIPNQEKIICTSEISPFIAQNKQFAEICRAQGGISYNCGCKKEFLCTKKLTVLVSGYNYVGRSIKAIPQVNIVTCPDGGEYFPSQSGPQQEDYQQECEARGFNAILVGCQYKQYLCSEKI